MGTSRPAIPFTYEDYKALPESRDRYELMNGDLYVTPAPTTTHQTISKNIEYVLEGHVRATGCGRVLHAPVDVVLEILSPGTERRDRGLKSALYARAGVREYWLVDPAAESIEVLALGTGGYDVAARYARADDLVSAAVPGLRMPLESVFERA